MSAAAKPAANPAANAAANAAIVELRQYTLHPRRRDDLIALFETRLIAPQEAVGAHVLGTFRDLDDPERFVWLRGFASMEARHAALTAFYGGPVWQAERAAANATMRDSDNVLLLRPAGPIEAAASRDRAGGAVLAVIHDLRDVDVEAFVALFDAVARPVLRAAGAGEATVFVTEAAVNTFVGLPVREPERVHVCFARFAGIDALDAAVRSIGFANALRAAASEALLPAFMRRPEILRLVPTALSLRG